VKVFIIILVVTLERIGIVCYSGLASQVILQRNAVVGMGFQIAHTGSPEAHITFLRSRIVKTKNRVASIAVESGIWYKFLLWLSKPTSKLSLTTVVFKRASVMDRPAPS
jgi:hypothetical protein